MWQPLFGRDSGWTDFKTLIGASSAWVQPSGTPAQIRRVGNAVSMRGHMENGGALTSFTTIGTLPIGWRPAAVSKGSGDYAYMGLDAVGAHITKGWRIFLSDGTVQVYSSSGSTVWGMWRLRWETDDAFPS